MFSRRPIIFALVGLSVIAVLVSVLLLLTPAPRSGGRVVAVTWGLPAEIVYRLGGGEIEVIQLLPPGAEIHEWEPTPETVREVARARLLVWTVRGFDDWALRLSESTGVKSFEAARGVQLMSVEDSETHEEHEHASYDVHFWLNPVNVKTIVEDVAEAFAAEFPELAPRIRANAEAMIGELEALHREISERLQPYRGRLFVTQHDSFRYLAEAYGLRVMAILGPEEEEPSAQHLREIVDAVRGLCVIYAEDGFVHPLVSSLSRDLNVGVMMLYTGEHLTLGDVRAGKGYVHLMRVNLMALVEGFECG